MAMTQCPDCGKEVSSKAPACPNCGYPVADEAEKAAAEKEKKKGLQGFVEFIRKQGVVGLAIGFIIGVAVGGVVTSFVNDLINPIIGAIIGQGSLDTLTFTIGDAVFNYGHFIGVLINFVVILAVVYFGFKALRLEKLDVSK
jgi:large conductance mechanosensitive channel